MRNGSGRIRTCEARRGRLIYSQVPSTSWIPTRSNGPGRNRTCDLRFRRAACCIRCTMGPECLNDSDGIRTHTTRHLKPRPLPFGLRSLSNGSDRIRTCTMLVLSQPPLPLGYRAFSPDNAHGLGGSRTRTTPVLSRLPLPLGYEARHTTRRQQPTTPMGLEPTTFRATVGRSTD